ncbi:NAD(P)H-dependent oxidoreductase [Rodentibacter heidelbergensis]|uniref:NAD(P)H oxidoreductase n=1 Tax=Rodentibacter heidelbergensis TaxID=1908258 RepID=A0A1V3IBU8_9PAST|nr:NAD(P)H-dependent oxidoreductase [Rodentibacter heidelbergensis]OOF37597.1 NAD(P)H oxidoreductase [Rodentibacter heidelbergensis]
MNHLIIFAHPNSQGSFGRAVVDRVVKASETLGVKSQLRDLYTLDFDPIISFEELQAVNTGIIPKAVQYEHDLIRQAELITLVYPLWWMGFPAMLKGYLDRVLSHGFAYKTENGESVGLLKGKQMQQFITLGSNVEKYKELGIDQSLDHCLVNGLFNYCGIENVTYELLGDLHLIDDEARRAMLDIVEQKTQEKLTALLNGKAV